MPVPSERVCCPACGYGRSTVTHVRHTQVDARAVDTWRRRECLQCHEAFTTQATERVVGNYRAISFTLHLSATSSTGTYD